MTTYARDLGFGAQLLAPGRTRFRFWAPGARRVELLVEGMEPLPLLSEPGGWFVGEAPCGAGAHYRYRLEDGTCVPDPAARAQAGDIDAPSVVVDPHAYAWRSGAWRGRPWHEAVLYELHVGLCGGYRGVAERLPALAALGVTAVELMPIAEFPGGRNWGYDGVLPYAPEASYGSPEDLKALVDRAHELGLMLFLDVVYNHFGPDGNWLHHYAPGFFRDDVTTPWGGAIDFRQEPVRRFFVENALYWLNEYRFDGLRFDAVHAIQPNAWLAELARAIRAGIEPGRQVHLVLENDDNSAALLAADLFDAQWNDDYHHLLHLLLTGEAEGYYRDYATEPATLLARALKEGFAYQGEASVHRGGTARGEPSGGLPPTAFVCFLQNHDQTGNRAFGERLVTLAPEAALRAAVALQLLAPQIPLLFQGEESGSREPFFYFTSHKAELAKLVREGRRREFAAFAGFEDPAKREAIPDPNDPETFERSRPAMATDGPWPALYGELLRLRRETLTPRLPGTRALEARTLGPAAVLARWRLGDGSRLTLAANLAADPVALPAVPEGRLLYGGEALDGSLPGFSAFAWLAGAA